MLDEQNNSYLFIFNKKVSIFNNLEIIDIVKKVVDKILLMNGR